MVERQTPHFARATRGVHISLGQDALRSNRQSVLQKPVRVRRLEG
jgi:hypothetical protein